MIKYDGYDEAIIGPAYIWRGNQQVEVLVYDAEKIREILMKDGCTAEEAREFDKMPFGDTAASFAIFVRNMKR